MTAKQTFDLTLTRTILAPRQKVFDAFVRPEMLKLWYGPRGHTVPEAQMDVRAGGRYRITMRARTGESYVVTGEYREVKPPERLVFTWKWEGEAMAAMGETLVTVMLAEKDGLTEVKLLHSGFPSPGARDDHVGGWNPALNCLVDATDERGSAASISVLGDTRSTYTRTVLMALAEKGVAYTLEQTAPHTDAIRKVHPFGRIPGFRDGDLQVFETSAIVRYLDESFGNGPLLVPGNARLRAKMEQWVSAITSYVYPAFIQRYVLQYIYPKGADGKPDRKVIDAALAEIAGHLAILDLAYGQGDWLAGGAPSIADLLLAPIIFYVKAMPEGAKLLSAAPNVARAHQAIAKRASFQATLPKM
jgi:glutathione S-transferase